MLIHEKTLPAISVVVGDVLRDAACRAKARVLWGAGVKGLMGVAVEDRHRTAKMRETYRTVLGDGIGELEAATRRICGFGEEPAGGEFCQDSSAGERAKLGILKASIGLDRGGVGFGLLGDGSFVSLILFVVLVGCEDFAVVTWCMPDVPSPGLPLPELQRPQIGRSGLPWCSSSYHTHCAHRQQSTKT